ncbi:hypothetical protein BABINDRAFT_10530 [Babjeviella inositovora NRRL Y-12698]|uniref:Vacuolar protein 14 C-terminal Fig4-binding domain-containing protein n=1 Tax=Babjeviella inositovora NRRL Y-12698 TaxID=984486 RepID=A0A1E3QH21_9ASCO|nr:uncharacterized protein BABINDRAFT_10530 [Babjeviella inositovora NRRL Y-12698]ODQ76995.1 hypothetical protein BABINDRAFT_10530 [Babjeviella inositovora NRRL Y-12698]
MESIISPSIEKDLANNIYEKRKAAALAIEAITRKAQARGDAATITKIISELTYYTHGTGAKMGAITALAGVAVALGPYVIAFYLEALVRPIFVAFRDTNARVRYYACESLYNIAKIARGEILLYFNEIFDILCILVTDTELSVKNAADLLDRLVKDIVCAKAVTYVSILHKESSDISLYKVDSSGRALQVNSPQNPQVAFSLVKFIPTLMERMYAVDPFARKFLLTWIDLLDDLPALELVTYMPTFFKGLLKFLDDSHQDVRIETHKMLNNFLKEIKSIHQVKEHVKAMKESGASGERSLGESLGELSVKDQDGGDQDGGAQEDGDQDGSDQDDRVSQASYSDGSFINGQDIYIDYPKLIEILVDSLDSNNLEIEFTVLKWLEELLQIAPDSFPKFLPRILTLLLPTLSRDNFDLATNAGAVDAALRALVGFESVNLQATIHAAFSQFMTEHDRTRVAALEWLIVLHAQSPARFFESRAIRVGDLLRSLIDSSPDVIVKILQLLSQISEGDEQFFGEFIADLIALFKNDRLSLSNDKYEFILRKLCQSLDSDKIYQTIAEGLSGETNLDFLSRIIQMLNNTLVTASELAELRRKLKAADDWGVFSTLFKAWSHNAPLALSLCLLTANYELAYLIVQCFADMEVNFNMLTQLDILVQLLESPVFMKMRLQLLEPEKHPYLCKSLYGLLMLLPQTSTFTALQNRLAVVNSLTSLAPVHPVAITTVSMKRKRINELLEGFKVVQQQHEQLRLQAAKKAARPRAHAHTSSVSTTVNHLNVHGVAMSLKSLNPAQ